MRFSQRLGRNLIWVSHDENRGQVRVSGADKYVDLGLSVLGATCNLSASSSEELGGCYAWGETSTKDEYTLNTYDPLGDGTGVYDDLGSDIAGTQYDAAYVNLGGKWRMPTRTEADELRQNTTGTYTTLNGVNGLLLTSTVEGYTDRSIFMPATGGKTEDEGWGYYWTSTRSSSTYSYTIVCTKNSIFKIGGANCLSRHYEGKHIRPVCDK